MVAYSNYSSEKELEDQLDLFYVFFQLLRKSTSTQQIEELKKLNKLISNWNIIKMYCCKNLWVKRIMEEVIPDYINAINRTNVNNNNNNPNNSSSIEYQNEVEPILGTFSGQIITMWMIYYINISLTHFLFVYHHILVELTMMIEILGSFSIHESELKGIFRFMQNTLDSKVISISSKFLDDSSY